MLDKVYYVEDSSLFNIRFFVSFRQVLQAFWTIIMLNYEPENPKNNKTNKNIKLINK
jgi:hypothetical protein